MKFIFSVLIGVVNISLIFVLGRHLILSAGFAGFLLGLPLLVVMAIVFLGSIIAGFLLQSRRIRVSRIELKHVGILLIVTYALAFFLVYLPDLTQFVKMAPFNIARSSAKHKLADLYLQPSHIPTSLQANSEFNKQDFLKSDGSFLFLKYDCGSITNGLVISQVLASDQTNQYKRGKVSDMVTQKKLIGEYYNTLYYRPDFVNFQQEFGRELPKIEIVSINGSSAIYAYEVQTSKDIIHSLFFDINDLQINLYLQNGCNLQNPKEELIEITESMKHPQ